MTLMKIIMFFILSAFTLEGFYSQNTANDYMDLLVLYVDGDYEKCLKKADKYMSKDETKKDALPYLYTSMAYYEMSRDHEYTEDYPRSYRQCLNYLSKYRRKDKEFIYKNDAYNFIEKIKFELAEQIENYELGGTEKDYNKSKSLLKKMKKIDPEDVGCQLLLGLHYIKAKDKSSGKTELKEGLSRLENFESEFSFSDMTPSQQYFFKEALIQYYEYKSNNYPQEAKEILLLGEPYYSPENENLEIDNYEDYVKLIEEVKS